MIHQTIKGVGGRKVLKGVVRLHSLTRQTAAYVLAQMVIACQARKECVLWMTRARTDLPTALLQPLGVDLDHLAIVEGDDSLAIHWSTEATKLQIRPDMVVFTGFPELPIDIETNLLRAGIVVVYAA